MPRGRPPKKSRKAKRNAAARKALETVGVKPPRRSPARALAALPKARIARSWTAEQIAAMGNTKPVRIPKRGLSDLQRRWLSDAYRGLLSIMVALVEHDYAESPAWVTHRLRGRAVDIDTSDSTYREGVAIALATVAPFDKMRELTTDATARATLLEDVCTDETTLDILRDNVKPHERSGPRAATLYALSVVAGVSPKTIWRAIPLKDR